MYTYAVVYHPVIMLCKGLLGYYIYRNPFYNTIEWKCVRTENLSSHYWCRCLLLSFLGSFHFTFLFLQTESEDDYGEARLSVSVPTPSLPHPTLSMPSVGDTAMESGGLCPSCRRTSGLGGSGGTKPIHPAYTFNMSTNDPDNMMRYFLDRQKFTEEGQAVVIEWRQLAATVDRILFWVFCVMTSVSSALFLIIIPGYNRGWFNPKPI